MADFIGRFRGLQLSRDMLAALGSLIALALLVMPLPGVVLDALFAANLALALVVLLLAASAEGLDRLAALPSVMVTGSLLRVGLCLAVARAIVAGGSAGSLAHSLGMQMSGGGSQVLSALVLVGLLATVSFILINLGVMRLAEVAARFALDAMPGRQLALDAALNAGRLTAEAGVVQAARLDGQQSFFGSMDGVARFLKGEAMAVVVITLAMPLGAAAGGGQVADQLIPALGQAALLLICGLLMGAGAALLLARAADHSEHRQFIRESLGRPAVLGGVAVALLLVGLAPGLAKAPLLVAAALLGVGGLYLHRAQWAQVTATEPPAGQLQLRLGLGLIGLLAGCDLPGLLARLRGALSDELGFAVPAFVIADDAALGSNSLRIMLGDTLLAEALLRPGRRLVAPVAESVLPGGGLETALPDGSRATWLREAEAESLARTSYHVLAPLEVLALHVQAAVRDHARDLFDLQRATELVQMAEVTHPATVAATRQAGITLVDLRDVGRCLLGEGIPLTERVSLLEALVSAPRQGAPAMAEFVRSALSHTISRVIAPAGSVEVIELGREAQQELVTALERSGLPLTLPPHRAARWQSELRLLAERFSSPGQPATVLCTPATRPAVAQLVAEAAAALRAVQPGELLPLTQVHTIYAMQAPSGEALAAAVWEGAN